MIKNVLVTGASGKLGNFVVPYLQDQGYNVVGTDIVLPRPDSENAKRGVPFVKADLLNIGDLMKAIAMAQPDAIVHLGAIPYNVELQPPYADRTGIGAASDGIRTTWTQPEDNTMKINTMGVVYVMDAARRMGVKNVITATSFFSYGMGFRISGHDFMPKYLPIDEEHPCEPEDSYSLSKYLGEEIMKAFVRAYDMNAIAMRVLGVYYYNSEASRKTHVFHRGFELIPDNEREKVMTCTIYEYVDARDIAVFTDLALQKIGSLPHPYEAFNVWTDTHLEPESAEFYAKLYPKLADMVKNLKGHDGLFSIEKARKLLGYEPQYSWRNEK